MAPFLCSLLDRTAHSGRPRAMRSASCSGVGRARLPWGTPLGLRRLVWVVTPSGEDPAIARCRRTREAGRRGPEGARTAALASRLGARVAGGASPFLVSDHGARALRSVG